MLILAGSTLALQNSREHVRVDGWICYAAKVCWGFHQKLVHQKKIFREQNRERQGQCSKLFAHVQTSTLCKTCFFVFANVRKHLRKFCCSSVKPPFENCVNGAVQKDEMDERKWCAQDGRWLKIVLLQCKCCINAVRGEGKSFSPLSLWREIRK